MPQPSLTTYFSSRKRAAPDNIINLKHKVFVLESDLGTSTLTSSTTATRKIVKVSSHHGISKQNNLSINAKSEKNIIDSVSLPSSASIESKIQESSPLKETAKITNSPKLVPFKKLGFLSPKKRLTARATETHFASKTSDNNIENGIKATKSSSLDCPKDMSLKEIKAKIQQSSRLADLQASLVKLQELEKSRKKAEIINEERARAMKMGSVSNKAVTVSGKSLQKFESIDLEVLSSPQKEFKTPLKLKPETPTSSKNELMSPRKDLPISKARKLLFSPVKKDTSPSSPTTSSSAVPAYQKYATLAESSRSTLQLPYKYRCLAEMFKCCDTVCAMFFNRNERITLKKLKPAVQRMCRKNFTEMHLAQIKTIYSDAFNFHQEKTRNFGSTSKQDYYQLVIQPNIQQVGHTKVATSGDNLTHAESGPMNPCILIKRLQRFNRTLLEIVQREHDAFLRSLKPPMIIPKEKVTRWHPEFDLEKCPSIKEAEIPQPPNVEKFSSAKEILCTARKLFNCNTPLERAMERLEAKKAEEALLNSTITASATVVTTPAIPKSDPVASVLKGVPQALLDKIRAKQAAKALDAMTRRPSQDQEAITYGRLPEIAKHLRNIFITEKKNVLPIEFILNKLINSYRGNLTTQGLEDHLEILAKETKNWLIFHEIRKIRYIKMAKNFEITKVMAHLQKLAAIKAA